MANKKNGKERKVREKNMLEALSQVGLEGEVMHSLDFNMPDGRHMSSVSLLVKKACGISSRQLAAIAALPDFYGITPWEHMEFTVACIWEVK